MSIHTTLKVVADENRLRILNLIKDDSLCVGEIQTILNMKQSNTSRHLEKLRLHNVLTYRKESNRIFYTIDSLFLEKFDFLKVLLSKDVLTNNQIQTDLERLQKYKQSGLTCDDLKGVDFDFEKLGL